MSSEIPAKMQSDIRVKGTGKSSTIFCIPWHAILGFLINSFYLRIMLIFDGLSYASPFFEAYQRPSPPDVAGAVVESSALE